MLNDKHQGLSVNHKNQGLSVSHKYQGLSVNHKYCIFILHIDLSDSIED